MLEAFGLCPRRIPATRECWSENRNCRGFGVSHEDQGGLAAVRLFMAAEFFVPTIVPTKRGIKRYL